MKVVDSQTIPDFSIKDFYGNQISIKDFRGQKVHLNFYRFSACPFCNLHFHQVEGLAELYKKNNVKLISVFESSVENMAAQIDNKKFYATMIPDGTSRLYKIFDLDRSMLKLLKYLFFKGGISNALKGMKLFTKKVKDDGYKDRIEAEFFIGADGKVEKAFYGKHPGDVLPLSTVKSFIES